MQNRTAAAAVLDVIGRLGVDRAVVIGDPARPRIGEPRCEVEIPGVGRAHVAYAIEDESRRLVRAAQRGRISSDECFERRRLLLGSEPAVDDRPLKPDHSGSTLLVGLLAHRAHKVYGAALGEWPEDSVEHVHDLRVAARRLREALAIAAPIIGDRKFDCANKRARGLARALGERRMVDVFIHDVKKYREEKSLPETALASFMEELHDRRKETTKAVHDNFPARRLIRHGIFVLSVAMSPKKSEVNTQLSTIAGAHLRGRIGEVAPILGVVENPREIEKHHELRIALKHLRYAAEILSEPYADIISKEQTIEPLRGLQDALGDLNDTQELLALARKHERKVMARTTVEGLGELGDFVRHLEQSAVQRYEAARDAVKKDGRTIIDRLVSAAAAMTRAQGA